MENSILISVVIPVYKVEEYLDRCIESVVNQTYENIEILLIDDGSPDGSGNLCDEWAKKDIRIKSFHKKNGGLSDARNYGTAIAKGKYITYIDSDDWVAKEYIEKLFKALYESNSDVAIGSLLKVKNMDVPKPQISVPIIYDGVSAVEEMLYQTSFDNSACCKMYKTEVMKEYLFPKGKLYEDLFTIYKVLINSDKVVFIDSFIYYYWVNPNSIMHASFNKRMFDEIDAADEIVDFIEKKYPEIVKSAYARKFSAYSQVLRWIPKKNDNEINEKQKTIWKFIKAYRFKMLFDKRARKKNRIAAMMSIGGKNFFKRI